MIPAARHDDVDERGIGVRLARAGHGRVSGRRREHLEAGALEERREEVDEARVVVDHQDS
jgi:hypothetical protein